MSPHKSPRHRSPTREAKRSRGSVPTVIAGETAPDERNANVQQSETSSDASEGDPWGDRRLYDQKPGEGTFSPGEIGDEDEAAVDPGNPQGVQGGRGPLNQEGEANRQNAEYEELEQPPEENPPHNRA